MKLVFLGILIIFSFSNIGFSQDINSKGGKTTTSRGKKATTDEFAPIDISENDLCNVTCESTFSKCYEANKKQALKCLTDVTTCKNKCAKRSGGK